LESSGRARKASADDVRGRIEALTIKTEKLSALMDSENAASVVRAALALEEMNQQSRAEPVRRISTGGIVILLGAPAQRTLPSEAAAPVLEMGPADE
jgi:hypothetical protein